jgi:hypothetical protein
MGEAHKHRYLVHNCSTSTERNGIFISILVAQWKGATLSRWSSIPALSRIFFTPIHRGDRVYQWFGLLKGCRGVYQASGA